MSDTPESFGNQEAGRLRRAFRWLRTRAQRLWEKLVPGARARRGAARGILVALILLTGFLGSRLMTSLGRPVDVLIGVVVGLLFLLIFALGFRLALAVVRSVPLFVGWLGAGGLLVFLFFILDLFGLPGRLALGTFGLVLVEALLGGALATLTAAEFGAAGRAKKAGVWAALVLAVAANAGVVVWLVWPGSDEHLVKAPGAGSAAVEKIDAPDPSQPGAYRVLSLTYGSGTDWQRREFGAGAQLKTQSVNATPFVKGFKGWRRKLRKWYWGFDADALPLNGRVWYPEGSGPFPLVLIVHGNHHMADYSDPGYAYLGELLASRGFILVSVDENFLNGSPVGGVPRENDARGWMLLQHVKVWGAWNATPGNPFHQKVDLGNIGLIGHSRGGEAAAHAAAFNRMAYYPDDAAVKLDFGFAIQAVIAIAPADGQYRPADRLTPLENVNYLTLQGGHDSDVSSFAGDRQFNRVKFTDGGDWFKASVYIYRANHGQFNTVWGADDYGPPLAWLLNLKPLLTGEEQRRAGNVYMAGFLEATLHGDGRYRPLFRDHRRAQPWLPETIYVTRYEDASFRLVADFEEDVDVVTTTLSGGRLAGAGLTVWREQDVKLRWGDERRNNAVYLGWNTEKDESKKTDQAESSDRAQPPGPEAEPPSFSLRLPSTFAREAGLAPDRLLVFHLSPSDEKAPTPEEKEKELTGKEEEKKEKEKEKEAKKDKEKKKEEEPLDCTIELIARSGVSARLPLSHFRPLPPVLKARFTKSSAIEKRWYKSESEPVFQTYELPLAAFVEAEKRFRPADLETIRFRFDRKPKGVVILDRVGFARP